MHVDEIEVRLGEEGYSIVPGGGRCQGGASGRLDRCAQVAGRRMEGHPNTRGSASAEGRLWLMPEWILATISTKNFP